MLHLIIFTAGSLVTSLIFVIVINLNEMRGKADGRLIIDEDKDAWTIAITTKPEEIVKRKTITLRIKKK